MLPARVSDIAALAGRAPSSRQRGRRGRRRRQQTPDAALGDGAGASASNVSDVALAQQHETYNSYSDLGLKLVLVERDKDISKLKRSVQALQEKQLKLEQKLSDIALALVEETDDHQALVAKVRCRVSQYSHVNVFGA